MSKPVSKTAVGAFVVVFAVLLFACVVFFGGMSFGKESAQYVIYVRDSINGLDIGSAVKFKGVKVGSVKAVRLRLEGQRSSDLAVPVIIEISRDDEASPLSDFDGEKLERAVRDGLRARIQMTSIVTGLLYVDLDFFPDTPVVLRGSGNAAGLPEIPTIPSNTSQMMKAVTTILEDLSEADFSALSAQMRRTVRRIEDGVAAIEFRKINDNVVRLTDSAATILEDPQLKETLENADRLIRDLDALSASIAGQVDPVAAELKTSLAELRAALADVSAAVGTIQGAFALPQGSLGQELGDVLVQINDAARAVRALAEYLQSGLAAPAAEHAPGEGR
ncbi:MAG TPA: MCE family protein [Candidatus Spyradosoma merdigallinarum]|uniref:MCE family protein n=1 Tax=Candidatus Spyradosoma merdigallinarum TaxID=2840950 RepID=A0A9D1T2D0_9BACT|nr:MCE family protein [Candidatus Spyradosoma merdigallinarum]